MLEYVLKVVFYIKSTRYYVKTVGKIMFIKLDTILGIDF